MEVELNERVLIILHGTSSNIIARRPIHLYSVAIVCPTATRRRRGRGRSIAFCPEYYCFPCLLCSWGWSWGWEREIIEGNGVQGVIYNRFLRVNIDGRLFLAVRWGQIVLKK